METSVIILAAGLSERIGFPKAFLKFNKEHTFIEKLIATYKEYGVNDIVLVLNQQFLEYYATRNYNFLKECITITNNKPENGRFFSIMLGCNAFQFPTDVFIQNVDNPFTTQELLHALKNNLENDNEVIIPQFTKNDGHPVLLGNELIEKIKKFAVTECEQNFREFILQHNVKKVATDNKNILINVNTMEIYKAYFGK